MRVVVTGGAGFLGAHVVELLEEAGHEPIVFDDLSTGSRDRLGPQTHFIETDVQDVFATFRLFRQYRVGSVVHLAGRPHGMRDVRPAQASHHSHEMIALGTLVAANMAGVPHVVFASSAAVYGDLNESMACEDHATLPCSANGRTKLQAEDFVRNVTGAGRTALLRFANLYGPGSSSICGSAVHSFIECLADGQSPTIEGTGHQTRDFVYVRDAARAVVAAVATKLVGPFNVGTGVETSIRDLVVQVADAFDVPPPPLRFLEPRPHDVQRSCLDGSRLEKALGFRAATTLDHGLRETVASRRATLLQN